MYSTALLFLVALSGVCNVINSKSFADPLENNLANSSDIAENYIALLLEINQPGASINNSIVCNPDVLSASLVPVCPVYTGDRRNIPETSEGRICGQTLGCLIDRSQQYWKDLTNVVIGNNNNSPTVNNATQLIEAMVSPYKVFEQTGKIINRKLRSEFEKDKNFSIRNNVNKIYTCSSINMCESLPGFKQLDYFDQQMVVRLGQSASRILVASINWYNAETRSFEDFLAWRNDEDSFKRSLLDCAAKISELRLEESDVAILNYLLLVGADYPSLANPGKIENLGNTALGAFQTYWRETYGHNAEEDERIAKIFSLMSEVKRLGYIHFLMTFTKSMKLEDCASWLNDGCDNHDAGLTA